MNDVLLKINEISKYLLFHIKKLSSCLKNSSFTNIEFRIYEFFVMISFSTVRLRKKPVLDQKEFFSSFSTVTKNCEKKLVKICDEFVTCLNGGSH